MWQNRGPIGVPRGGRGVGVGCSWAKPNKWPINGHGHYLGQNLLQTSWIHSWAARKWRPLPLFSCHNFVTMIPEYATAGAYAGGWGYMRVQTPPPPPPGSDFFFFLLLLCACQRGWWCTMGTPALCLESWPKKICGQKKKSVRVSPPTAHHLFQAWRGIDHEPPPPPPPLKKNPTYATANAWSGGVFHARLSHHVCHVNDP